MALDSTADTLPTGDVDAVTAVRSFVARSRDGFVEDLIGVHLWSDLAGTLPRTAPRTLHR